MRFFKRFLRFTGWAAASVVGFMICYLLMAVVLTIIPSSANEGDEPKGIEIFLRSNGVHTDLVLPFSNPHYHWYEMIDTLDFDPKDRPVQYVSFGWGDKGFYLETPTWAELKASTALKAVFAPSPTAMHVTLEYNRPRKSEYTRSLMISESSYRGLIAYINGYFVLEEGKPVPIRCCRYANSNDLFYEAKGNYHLFKTCNVWTNDALKAGGIKTAYWAPFDSNVLYHFEE
jgi:uncharacterized protein (TIGR02117 family)